METNFSNQINQGKKAIAAKTETDKVTATVEEGAKNLPNIGFLGVAMISMAASAVLSFRSKRQDVANFVGLWVPTLMLFGIYNKITQLEDELLLGTRH